MLRLTDPQIVSVALKARLQNLPDAIGQSQWAQFQTEFYEKLARLDESTHEDEREQLTDALLDLILPYETADELIRAELQKQLKLHALRNLLESQLNSLADITHTQRDLIIDAVNIKQLEVRTDEDSVREKGIYGLEPGGKHGATSAKIKNLQFNKDKLLALIGSLMTAGQGLANEFDPVTLIGGVIGLITLAKEPFDYSVNEQDASVLWGILCLPRDGVDRIATTASIRAKVHSERQRHNMSELSEREIQASLQNLQKLQVIQVLPSGNEWMLIEKLAEF